MTLQEAVAPEDVMHFNEKLLSFCGMLPPRNVGGLKAAIFPLYTISVLFALALVMTSLIIAVYQEVKDLQAASMAFCILCGFTASFGDSVCFVLSRNRVLKLLDEMRYRFIRSVPSKYSHLPIAADRTDKMVTMLGLSIYAACGFMWLFAPLRRRWTDNENGIWEKFAYPTWVPFDLNTSPASEIIFIWQLLSMSLGVFTICCVDTFFAAIMHQVCVQFSILSRLLADMEKEAKEQRTITYKTWNNGENEALLKHGQTNEEYLVSCIKKHQDILEYFKRANEVTSIANMFQLANIPFVLCITGFHISLSETTWDNSIKNGGLLFAALFKLLLLCWYGQHLIDQSLEVDKAIYTCNWMDQSMHFKHIMPMVMMRSQKPVKFSAWHFYSTISFATFTAVLNTTYSYFTLLHQIMN